MKSARILPETDSKMLPRMPPWVTSTRADTPEEAAFLSGAALGHLHLILTRPDVPQTLFRARLALRATTACTVHAGRHEGAAALRDEICLLRPGDQPGPAGAIYLQWRRAVERPVTVKALHRALPAHPPDQIAGWLDAGQGGPIMQAAAVAAAVLHDAPRAESAALILADAALARAMGWDHLMPLLAAGLKRADLRKTGDDLRMACHRAVTASAMEAVCLVADLTRRVARLNAVAPKLRTKGAAAAVEMFRTRDAVAPSMLALPDRAARRFCDRLVSLGVARELTGRDTFRLYGV